jgi:hypothetical protein
MMSPERHSPFPVAGLEIRRPSKTIKEAPPGPSPKRQRGNAIFKKSGEKEDDDDDDESPLVGSRIRDIDGIAMSLEVLFNSPAVTGSDTDRIASIADYDKEVDLEDTAEALTRRFQKERQMRRRSLPDPKVVAMCQEWTLQTRLGGNGEDNLALQLIDQVDGWTVCKHKIAENVYADIWKSISKVYSLGMEADAQAAAAAPSDPVVSNNEEPDFLNSPRAFNIWMKSLGRPLFQAADKPPSARPMVVKSEVFVATKFCAFNAQSFKRFAITVNAALKRLTDGRMFLEGKFYNICFVELTLTGFLHSLVTVFHPEYVGNKGYNSGLRRSPFPLIQICYEVKK